ncbi:hypothetical protein FPV67DRAFT_1493176 [Lyophyllum atratum]|nr:hypothetical protein FPV67DRAFT_1493176 [Lyophyllum atratum]
MQSRECRDIAFISVVVSDAVLAYQSALLPIYEALGRPRNQRSFYIPMNFALAIRPLYYAYCILTSSDARVYSAIDLAETPISCRDLCQPKLGLRKRRP